MQEEIENQQGKVAIITGVITIERYSSTFAASKPKNQHSVRTITIVVVTAGEEVFIITKPSQQQDPSLMNFRCYCCLWSHYSTYFEEMS